MSYRRTKSYSAERLRAMQSSRDRSRMAGPAPTYPPALPDMRIRITVERFDHGEQRHVIELHRTGRVDVYRATVDGQPWLTAGLSRLLAGLRKALPRVTSPRAIE